MADILIKSEIENPSLLEDKENVDDQIIQLFAERVKKLTEEMVPSSMETGVLQVIRLVVEQILKEGKILEYSNVANQEFLKNIIRKKIEEKIGLEKETSPNVVKMEKVSG